MPAVINAPQAGKEWSLEASVKQFFDEGMDADGTLISHQWLETALLLPKPRTVAEAMAAQWITLERVEQFKCALLANHRIALANVRGEGYRVVPPADQAAYAVVQTMNGVRRELRKGCQLLKYTRTELLSDSDRKRHTDATVKMQAIQGMARKEKRDVLKLFSQKAV